MSAKTEQPWKILARHLLLSAPPWLHVYREELELPSGKIIPDFYRVVLPEFSIVLPITNDGAFVLVRGYKHGVGKVTLQPPAGLIAANETPLQAAQRELLEETGYQSDHWQALGKYIVDGNRQCGTMHVFAARAASQTQLPNNDETEQLKVELFSREQVLAALRTGEMSTLAGAGGIALALLLYDCQ